MKYFLSIIYIFIIIIFIAEPTIASDPPAWWKQVADEAKKESYSLVTLEGLKKLYEADKPFLIVDVRIDYEYDEGHLPDAASFEFDLGDKLQLKPKKKETFLKLLGPDKNQKIIFYCRSFR